MIENSTQPGSTSPSISPNRWENIRTRALLLGMSLRDIDRRIDTIAEFSNLGEFLDIPARHYSAGRMNGLMERANIVVFATHSLNVLPRFCKRTILLSHGRIVADGPTGDVGRLYADAVRAAPGAFAEKVQSHTQR